MSVELYRHEEFAVLKLNRPEALNALSFQILKDIGEALDAVRDWKFVRCLFVAGAGEKAFCAGADIKELNNRSQADQRRGAELGQHVFLKLDDLPIPSIALVNGYAFGGGCELSMACSFRIAAPNAIFGLPEIRLGLIPGYGGTQRLQRIVGTSRALEMIMTAEMVKAEEAKRIGLVSAIAEGDLMEAGVNFARRFSCFSLTALALARRAVFRAADVSLAEGMRIEADLSTLAFQTEDAAEGIAAFQEKRKAEFKDV